MKVATSRWQLAGHFAWLPALFDSSDISFFYSQGNERHSVGRIAKWILEIEEFTMVLELGGMQFSLKSYL